MSEVKDATVTLTPSGQIVHASAQSICVTDALGREIQLKNGHPLGRLRATLQLRPVSRCPAPK